jgi:hypothetical protein
MKDHYKINYTTSLPDARLIIGVRYEMELRPIVGMNPYVFAGDVGTDFLSLLKIKNPPGSTSRPPPSGLSHKIRRASAWLHRPFEPRGV